MLTWPPRAPEPRGVRGPAGRGEAAPGGLHPLHNQPGGLGDGVVSVVCYKLVCHDSITNVQCLGAVLGSAILYGATPEAHRATLGANGLGEVPAWAGVLLELLLTMLLVLVVFATAVDQSRGVAAGLAPLLIGLTVTGAHVVLIPYTGTSINPARSLGPALVGDVWDDHWVFWVGPLLGGALGGVLYTFGLSG